MKKKPSRELHVPARNRTLAVALIVIAFATAVLSISDSGAAALIQQASSSGEERVVINRAPTRAIKDAYPGFSGVFVDSTRDEIVVNDENLFQVMVYDRTADTPARASFTEPKRIIGGPDAITDFHCGIYVDPTNGDVYILANDVGDTVSVFEYGSQGNKVPDRTLFTGRGYGLTVDEERQELYVTRHNAVDVYRKEAEGFEEPLRTITGPRTRLGSINGIAIDKGRDVMFVVSHGNYSANRVEDGAARYEPSLITVYPLDADGNIPPVRVIQGSNTQMNHPGLAFADEERGELYVANNGDNSVLVFDSDSDGNIEPLRVIKGPRTRLTDPRAVFVDLRNDELVVSNLGNHSIVVFPRDADGDATPLRTIRAAPEGKHALMMANPGAIGYDSRRGQIIAPN